jgi:Flp pilus assembly protein TadB
MFRHRKRKTARARTLALLNQHSEPRVDILQEAPAALQPREGLSLLLSQAALGRCSTITFITLSLVGAGLVSALLSYLLSPLFAPLVFALAVFLPFSWLEARVSARSARFCEDYPIVLLATASSLKTGMTPYLALERAVKLLAKTSLVRTEVETLLSKLQRGNERERVLREFAATIRLPDLALFRSAFLILLENGGRFAPTLERLATVTKDRTSLIASARVSTAIMRMTANVLLAVTPLIVGVVALRTPDYFQLFREHPVANLLGTTGVIIIAVSYVCLRRMSDFQP